MAFKVGEDIDAFCTKCQLDTIHVVVALKPDNTVPKRVECKSCHGQHMYRAPKLPSRTAPASQPAPINRSAAARNPAPPKPAKPAKPAPVPAAPAPAAKEARDAKKKSAAEPDSASSEAAPAPAKPAARKK